MVASISWQGADSLAPIASRAPIANASGAGSYRRNEVSFPQHTMSTSSSETRQVCKVSKYTCDIDGASLPTFPRTRLRLPSRAQQQPHLPLRQHRGVSRRLEVSSSVSRSLAHRHYAKLGEQCLARPTFSASRRAVMLSALTEASCLS